MTDPVETGAESGAPGAGARPAREDRARGDSRGDRRLGGVRVHGRVAAGVTRAVGSMGSVYLTVALTLVWMLLGARGVLGFDPYPYPLLLFAGNVVQLLLIFVILVGQRVLGTAGGLRAEATWASAQGLLVRTQGLQDHMQAQTG